MIPGKNWIAKLGSEDTKNTILLVARISTAEDAVSLKLCKVYIYKAFLLVYNAQISGNQSAMAYSTNSSHQGFHEKPLEKLGPYQIESVLGRGGVSMVYKAQRRQGQPVALKVLFTSVARQPNLRKRFQQEYRILSRLRHRGIIGVHDMGEINGRLYIAMSLLQGETLESMVSRAKKLGEVVSIEITRQLADILDYLHRQGIIHRDIKTSNVMITPDRRVILFDFGTALLVENPLPEDFQGIFGTPPFVSPEQIEVKADIDGRADLYSLGIILYRMVAGRKPFYGTRSELLEAHLHHPPPPPSDFAHVSPALESIIMKLLEKDPAHRFQTGSELIDALNQVEILPDEPSLPRQLLRWFKLPISG